MATPIAEQINAAIHGFDRLYGLEMLECSDSRVRARVAVGDQLKQAAGLVHGGVYAAMASIATALAVLEQGQVAMGLSNNTSFLRPITEGVLHGLGTRLHRGRTTWVWDVRFSDDAERTCAVTRMTVAVRPMPEARS